MVCENCKEKPANITVTQVQNGQKTEHQYCEICASKFHPFQFEMKDEPISLQQFITNWFGMPMKSAHQGKTNATHVECPHCNMKYQQFLKKGKFGCAMCYHAFKSYLPSILEKLQAGTTHVTDENQEILQVQKVEARISELKQLLKQAVDEERFEDAVTLRDEIKLLSQNNAAGGANPQ